MRIAVRDLFDRAGIGIWLMDERDGGYYVAKPTPLIFERRGDSDGCFQLPEPTLVLLQRDARDFFQGLIDELSRMGYRPNTDRLAGELEATKKFLEREQSHGDRNFRLLEHTVQQTLLPPTERSR